MSTSDSRPADPATSAPEALPPLAPRPRRRWLGVLLALVFVGLLAGGAYWLVQRAKAPAAGARPAGVGGPGGGMRGGRPGASSVTVGSALARQGELPVLVEALGTVTPQTTVALQAQVSGTLTDVLFTEGQQVTKGQLLARIDPRQYDQALAQAKAQRARDDAQLSAAQVTLKRYETLWKQDSIARQDVDTQAALVKQLAATVASDRANEAAAQLNVNHTRIVAPITGRIGLRAVDPGNLVAAGSATGIATITQMDPIDVVFAVPQDRVPAVLAAQRAGRLPVTALDRARSQTVGEGVFSTLDNVIDTATGTVRAKARFTNTDGQLFPNQFVNVRLQLGASVGVLVPVTAVRTGPQGDYVYVIDVEGVAHTRAVTRGLATVDQMLIAKGLQAGERVVTEGGDRVKDGAKVQLQGRAPAGGASGAAAAQGRASGARRGASAPSAGASGPADAASGADSRRNGAPGGATSAQAAMENAAGGAAGATPGTASPAVQQPAWLERLSADEREKVMALPPDQRRAYIEQLRARRPAGEGGGARN